MSATSRQRLKRSSHNAEIVETEKHDPQQNSTEDRWGRAAIFCCVLAIVPFLLFAVGLGISQTTWFTLHSGNKYLANVGYGAKLQNANCEIVIYGDSSAMAGIDPRIVEQKTGLSTCNIAELAGMTMVNGFLIPDLYLAHNAKPRVFLFDFAPENLAPYPKWQTVSLFEAILFRLRVKRDFSTAALLGTHPRDLINFATLALRLSLNGIAKQPLEATTLAIRDDNRGYFPTPGGGLESCPDDHREHPASPDWIAAIKKKYGQDGTIVIVDATPEPACDVNLDYYAHTHVAPTDNKLEIYPSEYFNASGRLHMTRPGTDRFSNAIGEQISLKLTEAAPATASKANQ